MLLSFLLLMLGAASICEAGPITYNVNLTIGTGTVTGTIVTDGLIGTLAAGDILSVNLLLNNGTDPPDNVILLPPINPVQVSVVGSDLSATASQLLFNFSGADQGVFSILDISFDYGVTFCAAGGSACLYPGAPPGPLEVFHFTKFPGFVPANQFLSLSGTQVIASAGPIPPATMVAILVTAVKNMQIPQQGTSLTDQLQQVETDINTQNRQACPDLNAFANHVNAQTGKTITATQANQILAAVASIEAALKCGP